MGRTVNFEGAISNKQSRAVSMEAGGGRTTEAAQPVR